MRSTGCGAGFIKFIIARNGLRSSRRFTSIPPAAGGIYTLCTALGEFFYHTSVRTPRWVGFVFQRPEMHRIHHRYNRHRNNYGDITWWDMLFGTYENPKEWTHTCGFDDAKEQQLFKMLAYQDVHRETE